MWGTVKTLLKNIRGWPQWGKGILAVLGILATGLCGYISLILYSQSQTNSTGYIRQWFDDRSARNSLATERDVPCPEAPFLLPSKGLIGLLWRDPALPYNVLNRHSGIDIFGDGELGEVPVVAAYEGYLTRRPEWVSSVIIQHEDPLRPGETIWSYYTHMASSAGESTIVEDFPPGSSGVWVKQGTLLGYQGNYSGNALRPTGLHLHFSVVTSEDDGSFKNESQIENTLDPSPYLGMNVNIEDKPARPIRCEKN
jgi:murein DD-endopeptidase MepM/ murein hydrolase activator NlpD